MALTPPYPLQERILVIGLYGSGKTRAWLEIARLAQKSGSDARFYCIDTDDGTMRLLYTEFRDLQNVEVRRVLEWEEYVAAAGEFAARVRPLVDWLVVDMIDLSWDEAQNEFVEEVHGKDLASYLLEVRRAMEEDSTLYASGFSGTSDWPVIKALYRQFIQTVLFRHRGHVFACAPVEKLDYDRETDKVARLLFGSHGVKPRGEKRLGHQFHTVLWLNQPTVGDFRLTTIKDRGRPSLDAARLSNFALQYLVQVAGWTL